MKEEQKISSIEFGILMFVGIVAVVAGTDLTGRHLHFVYGE